MYVVGRRVPAPSATAFDAGDGALSTVVSVDNPMCVSSSIMRVSESGRLNVTTMPWIAPGTGDVVAIAGRASGDRAGDSGVVCRSEERATLASVRNREREKGSFANASNA